MEDFRDIGRRVRNWGRWGDDDERGTVNLITPERIASAAGLIRRGATFDLGIPVGSSGPQPGRGRINPVHLMSETGADQLFPGAFRFADDYIFMPLQSGSQWDALSHVFYDGQMYNGFAADNVSPHGAKRCSIDKMGKGIVGRGVLLDVARMMDVDWLEAGYPISPEDLNRACNEQRVEVGEGDILLFRTGWRRKFLTERDPTSFMAGEPGLSMRCAEWLHDRGVAAVGSDNWAIEVLPGEIPEEKLSLHMVLIRDMGMSLAEILDFEELSADCANDGIYDFFFCAPPLKVTNGVGSPINPLAIK